MTVEVIRDPREFERRAGPLIRSRVHGTVLATVLHGILEGRFPDAAPLFAIVGDDDGTVVGAGLRTPPWPLITTALDPEDAADLMREWLAADPELAIVNAQTETARALAAAAQALTGCGTALDERMALHVVDGATLREPPRPADGTLRAPRPDELDLCVAWERAFADEAAGTRDGAIAERMARQRVAAGRAYVWDAGATVSLIGHTPMIDGVPRIGPVYTPPEHRSHGYASTLVHALTRRLLNEGATRVVLFTDLANPTSNRIYADVGYERIGDWEIIRLCESGSG